MSVVLCVKCQQPVKNVPPWLVRVQARFVCDACNPQKAVDFQTVLNNIRSRVQEEAEEDSFLLNDEMDASLGEKLEDPEEAILSLNGDEAA